MQKKLLGLLPLVWLAVLAPHWMRNTSCLGFVNTPGTAEAHYKSPTVSPRRAYYVRASDTNVDVTVNLQGHILQCVSVDGSPTGLSHPLWGEHITFQLQDDHIAVDHTPVTLIGDGIRRLPNGLQRLRFTLDDGSFADFDLIISDKSPGETARQSPRSAKPSSTTS